MKKGKFLRSFTPTTSGTNVLALFFGFALMIAPFVLSAAGGGLPNAQDLGLGGATAPAKGLPKYLAWGIKMVATVLAIASLIGAGYWSLGAFGEASERKGGMGRFFGIFVTAIIMVALIVSLMVIALKWADSLATIVVTSVESLPLVAAAQPPSAHILVLHASTLS